MDWAARSVAYIAQQPAPAQPGATGPHLPRWGGSKVPGILLHRSRGIGLPAREFHPPRKGSQKISARVAKATLRSRRQ